MITGVYKTHHMSLKFLNFKQLQATASKLDSLKKYREQDRRFHPQPYWFYIL